MRVPDYPSLMLLWKEAGLESRPKGRDSRASIKKQLSSRNCRLLLAESNKKLVGSVIATHDSRKGWVNRLAVHPDFRRKGVAKLLIADAERWFRSLGLVMSSALIMSGNRKSKSLFASSGYALRRDVLYFSKRLNDNERKGCCC